MTSTHGWARTLMYGQKFWDDMELASATTTEECCWSSVQSMPWLSPTPSFSRRPDSRLPFQHPRSKHWHLLDDKRTQVRYYTPELCLAPNAAQIRLVWAKVRLSIKPSVNKRGPQMKKLDVGKLSLKKEVLQMKLPSSFESVGSLQPGSRPREWVATAENHPPGNNSWGSWLRIKEEQRLIWWKRCWNPRSTPEEKSRHGKLLACPDDQATREAYRSAWSTLQTKLREIQNWWLALTERTHLSADLGNTRAFY